LNLLILALSYIKEKWELYDRGKTKMSEDSTQDESLERISFRAPQNLKSKAETQAEEQGYTNTSEFYRAAVREKVNGGSE
jgi:hypothetical protein